MTDIQTGNVAARFFHETVFGLHNSIAPKFHLIRHIVMTRRHV